MPPPTPSLASSAAMPASVPQRQGAGAQQQEQQRGVHRHVGEREQRSRRRTRSARGRPSRPAVPAIASAWCSSARAAAAPRSSSDRPNNDEARPRWPAPCAARPVRRSRQESAATTADRGTEFQPRDVAPAASASRSRRPADGSTTAGSVAPQGHAATARRPRARSRAPSGAPCAASTGSEVGELLHVQRPAGEHEHAHHERRRTPRIAREIGSSRRSRMDPWRSKLLQMRAPPQFS